MPAAAERRAELGVPSLGERHLQPPELETASVVAAGGIRKAELVWSGLPGPIGSRYLVEVARLPAWPETWGSTLLSTSTEGSAMAVPVPDGSTDVIWRVAFVDKAHASYATSHWQGLGGAGTPEAGGVPAGRVTIHVGSRDKSAQWLAEELLPSLRLAGLWVRIERDANAARAGGVQFAFVEDAALAGEIAEVLPATRAEDATLVPSLDLMPGEIGVHLVGGPSKPYATGLPSPSVIVDSRSEVPRSHGSDLKPFRVSDLRHEGSLEQAMTPSSLSVESTHFPECRRKRLQPIASTVSQAASA